MRPATASAAASLAGVHPSRHGATRGAERLHVPDVASLGDALAHHARTQPDAIAMHFVGFDDQVTSLTYAELLARAQRVATTLAARGVGRGHAVVCCFDTGPALLATFLGCSLLGAAPVLTEMPLGSTRTRIWAEAVARMAQIAGARALVVDDDFRAAADEVARSCELPLLGPADFSSSAAAPPALPALGADDIAFIQFSSGTTGAPKGISVTHGALLANARAMGARAGFVRGDATVGWLPLYHDMGLVGVTLTPLLHGLPVALMSPMAFLFKPERWLWALHHFRATMTCAPNFAYQLCAKRLTPAATAGLDLGSLHLAFNGAEQVQRDTLTAFAARFAPHGFRPEAMYPVYGMAEAALGVAFPDPGAPPRVDLVDRDALTRDGVAAPGCSDLGTIAFVSVGRPLDGYEVRIAGGDGEPLPERRQGQILLRGPSITRAYVNAPDDSTAAFRDGWLCTGDLGYLADGELFVCGRSKDLIIKAGRNYHPHTFESSAARVPGVRVGCVAAIAARNAEAGTEDVVVVFETRVTDRAELAALKAAVEAQIQRDVGLRPERLIAVPPQALPKTSSGKVARSAVVALVVGGRLREPA